MEKATTTNAVTIIALRSGTLAGTASASARASAPRRPPQKSDVLTWRRQAPPRAAEQRGKRVDGQTRVRRVTRRIATGGGAGAKLPKRLVGDVHPDQDEHEAVGEEGEELPR